MKERQKYCDDLNGRVAILIIVPIICSLLCPGIVHLRCTINSFNCYDFLLLGREEVGLSYFYQGK